MGILSLIFCCVLTLITLFCVYMIWVFREREKYFKNQGVPYIGAGVLRNLKALTGSLNFISMDDEIYKEAKKFKAPIVAASDSSGQASLVIMSPDIIKRVMVKDFDHFVNQRLFETETSSKYFTKMLFIMRDEQWKALRVKMTPAFSTGKIKRMFQMFSKSSQRLDTYLKQQINFPETKSMEVDFVNIFIKYSMEVIAGSAFAVDSKSWDTKMDEFSTFDSFGQQFQFKLDAMGMLKGMIMMLLPKLADVLELEILDYKSQTYFADIIKDVIKRRRQTGERREDFLQLMIDIQQGTLKVDNEKEEEIKGLDSAGEKLVFDDDHLIANTLMFFSAGFDPMQTVLLFAVYSLALEQTVQEKLFEEVKSVTDKHEGNITYEALMEMPYLDMVINETMRIYPTASHLERECSADYVVEETGYKIEKGTVVVIPAHGIHHDSEYYPDPEKFIPERFSPENKAKRHQYTYLPWGYGPRSCIGMRFAQLMVKTVIAQVITCYKLAPCSKTQIPVKFDSSVSAKPVGGMWLNVTVRER